MANPYGNSATQRDALNAYEQKDSINEVETPAHFRSQKTIQFSYEEIDELTRKAFRVYGLLQAYELLEGDTSLNHSHADVSEAFDALIGVALSLSKDVASTIGGRL